MASVRLRRKENVSGEFFVDETCIDCDLCRQIAPAVYSSAGDRSAVHHQPESPKELSRALEALVTCPTASIGTLGKQPVRAAIDAYPEPIEPPVYFCGFAAAASYGASSYLVVRPEGNVLVDSPRFASQLAERIAALGGVRFMFLTHRDDVADHAKWARRFDAERILHEDDVTLDTARVERRLQGIDPVALAPDLVAIPTPGHTRGHSVLLFRDRFLFTGDHLWWSDSRQGLWASRSVCWHSWPDQIVSLQRLLAHRFEWVLPGHGRRAHAPQDDMRRLLEALIARLRPQARA
jgi:glyoxylase-like metal-dependent hydrolase (beta-lactamase superfamily II)/ferredoxin